MGSFSEQVWGESTSTDSDPATLWLEVTETALADVSSLKTFETLHELGIRLAIDDFGTGWSSMARLSGFPWDLLKIDRSFVSPLGTGGRADQVVESMIAMAHALDIQVVAEGVETHRQLRTLTEMGCDIAQGYLIAKPTDRASAIAGLSTSEHWRPWPLLDRNGPSDT